MSIISEDYRKRLTEEFSGVLVNNVKLMVFTRNGDDCIYCKETALLAEEMAELSDKISSEIVNENDPRVSQYGIDKYPALIISGDGVEDGRVRYYGIPSGYEFSSLVEDIETLSRKERNLSKPVMEKLSAVKSALKIKVFVTPTCPYCPNAVKTAHKFAMMNSNITGEMIEVREFSEERLKWLEERIDEYSKEYGKFYCFSF